MTGTGTPIVITAAAGPADASVSERVPRRRPGHVRHHAGAGRPPGGTSGEMEALGGTDGMIIDGDKPFCIVFFCQCMSDCRNYADRMEIIRSCIVGDCRSLFEFVYIPSPSSFRSVHASPGPVWLPSPGCASPAISSASPTPLVSIFSAGVMPQC